MPHKISIAGVHAKLLQWTLAVVIGAIAAAYAPAYAVDRNVVVNGVSLSAAQILQLERLHGEYIPDGRYWLDVNTGIWGYEGGPAQGLLGRPNVELNGVTGGSGVPGQLDPGRGFEDYTHDFCMRNPEINCL